MQKCVKWFVPVIPAIVLVFLAATLAATNAPVRADNACIEQPNQPAPEGARWSSRYDRAKGRKCWFLSDAPTPGHDVAAPQEQAGAAPTLSSRLVELFDSLTGASTNAAPQSNATSGPRNPQTNAPALARAENGNRADQRNAGESRVGTRAAPPMTQAERKALFEEFLRWYEIQPNSGR